MPRPLSALSHPPCPTWRPKPAAADRASARRELALGTRGPMRSGFRSVVRVWVFVGKSVPQERQQTTHRPSEL